MKLIVKKYLFVVLSLFCLYTVYSQGSLSIPNVFIAPSSTLTSSSTFTAEGYILNTGTVSLTGTVAVNMAINTSTTSTPNYVFRNSVTYSLNSYAPAATSQTFMVTDVASGANQYMTDGNGTTVVVWPVMSNVITQDSAKTTIHVNMPTGIEDLSQFEKELLKIENPVAHNIELTYDNLIYRNVELINERGQVVQVIQNKTLYFNLLGAGMYYLNYYNSETNKIIIKKLLIE